MRRVKSAHVVQDMILTDVLWDAVSLCSACQSEERSKAVFQGKRVAVDLEFRAPP